MIYEHDYTGQRTGTPSISMETDAPNGSGMLRFFSAFVNRIPKVIVKKEQEAFERLVSRLDKRAQEYGGKIYAVIDYEKWFSKIEVTLPCLEFFLDEDMSLLRDISENAFNVSILPTEGGTAVLIRICIGYFAEVPIDEEDIEMVLDTMKLAASETGSDLNEMLDHFIHMLEEYYPEDPEEKWL